MCNLFCFLRYLVLFFFHQALVCTAPGSLLIPDCWRNISSCRDYSFVPLNYQTPFTFLPRWYDGAWTRGYIYSFFFFCAFCVMFRYILAEWINECKVIWINLPFLFCLFILCILSSPDYNPLIKATTNHPLFLLFLPILTRTTHHTRPNTPNLRPNLMPLLLSFTP